MNESMEFDCIDVGEIIENILFDFLIRIKNDFVFFIFFSDESFYDVINFEIEQFLIVLGRSFVVVQYSQEVC